MITVSTRQVFLAFCIFVLSVPYCSKLISRKNIEHTYNHKKVIIFDLGGVLLETNMRKAINFLGISDLSAYKLFDWKNPSALKFLFYTILHQYHLEKNSSICDPYGDPLPLLLCDIMKGNLSESDCHALALELLHKNRDLFCSKREHRLCKKTTEMLLDPKIFIQFQELYTEGFLLLQECINRGYIIIILSNYGKEGFELVFQKFPQLFENIRPDHIIVSAHVGCAKPEQEIYQLVLQKIRELGINPHYMNCFLIDDQKENVEGAQAVGITGIHHKSPQRTRMQLKHYGVL